MNSGKKYKIGVVGVSGGWSSERLADAVKKMTGERILIDMNQIILDLHSGCVRKNGFDLSALDGLIVKKISSKYSPYVLDRLEILRFLKARGLRIFSDPEKIYRAIDRLSCTATLRLGGIPMPPTVITENVDEAVLVIERFGEAVLKPLYTSKARGMKLLRAENGLRDSIREFRDEGNPLMYIQKKIELPGKDLGIVFLGGKYLATYARVIADDAWNTTTQSGGKYQSYEPDPEIIELAHKAQQLFGLDFTCVDLAETPDGPMIFEVSAFGGFRGLLEANNIEAADLYCNYVLEALDR